MSDMFNSLKTGNKPNIKSPIKVNLDSTIASAISSISPVVTSTPGVKQKTRVTVAKSATDHTIKNTVENNTGGRVYSLTPLEQFKRFLILGCSGGTYYTSPISNFNQSKDCIQKAFDTAGPQAVQVIKDISTEGLATSNEPAIYALSKALAHSNVEVRQAAAEAISNVCRTGTHLYHFMEYKSSGGGRLFKKAISNWFFKQPIERLAYTMMKYQSRDGWSSRDVLRLGRPTPPTPAYSQLFNYIVKDVLPTDLQLQLINDIKSLNSENVISMIQKHNLSLEMIPTALHTKEVYSAILNGHPGYTWVIRNLPTMTRLGVLTTENITRVTHLLNDKNALQKARIHPLNVLIALETYNSGKSIRGSSTWTPIRMISNALESALLLSFKCIDSTELNYSIGLDVSGSMSWQSHFGCPNIKTRNVGAIMALGLVNAESNVDVYGFGTTLTKFNVTKATSYAEMLKMTNIDMGVTNLGLLIEEAIKHNKSVDCFVVFTDNEVNSGKNVAQLLRNYRAQVNKNAKLVVCAMTSTNFSIADPDDFGMLDIPGETADLPKIVATFATM